MAQRINPSRLLAGAVSLVAIALLSGCHSKTPPTFDPNSTAELQPDSYPNSGQATNQSVVDQTLSGVKKVFWDLPVQAISFFSGNTPLTAAQNMEDPDFPDNRRRGIYALAAKSWGRKPPYTERYAQLAEMDSDWTVRAAAIRALNASRDQKATPLFIAALTDPQMEIRLEGAKALGNVPDDAAVPTLIKMMASANENKDVRVAAARALVFYRRLDVGRALVGVLQDKEFVVAWQARQTLIYLTGKDYRYSTSQWLELLTGDATPLG